VPDDRFANSCDIALITGGIMALWNQPPANNDEKTVSTHAPAPATAPIPVAAPQSTAIPVAREGVARGHRESVLGAGVTLEGKIEGDGDVRIAGKVKGEIRIGGDLIVDRGARLNAKINAANVTVGGELEGNIAATGQVKLLESCQMVGDLKANTLTVAAGSRMRGHVEFGWNSASAPKHLNGDAREHEKKTAEAKAPNTPASA
jgi:cytoskeletal protein CcmA (bactofilin family)